MISEPDPVINTFRQRMFRKDLDVLCPVVGKRGTTKSGSTITICDRLDRGPKTGKRRFFLPSKLIPKNFKLLPGEFLPRTVYMPSHFMAIINQRPRPPVGTGIVWDETGVEGDSRDFMKKKNKLLKRTFETIRSFNYAIFLTAPTMKSFDVAYSRVSAFVMRTTDEPREDSHGAYGSLKVYEYDVNAFTGKPYPKHIQYVQDGLVKKLEDPYLVSRPPAFFERPYKRFKQMFQTTLYRDYEKEFDDIEALEVEEEVDDEASMFNRVVERVKATPWDFYDFKKKKFVVPAVQYNSGVRLTDAMTRKVIQLLNFKLSQGAIVLKK